MFDLEWGEDLRLIVETARSFAENELGPKLREHEGERAVGVAVRERWAQTGLVSLEVPEAFGGAGLGALARVLVNEELAAADAGAALALDPFGPALYPLIESEEEDRVGDWLQSLLEEPGARALLVDASEARLEIGETLSGRVEWVAADRVDLLVATSEKEITVVSETDGISLEPLRGAGLCAAGASALRLQAAPVAARLGVPSTRARARARLYVASLLVGVLRQAAIFSREYALEREAFGRPIAHHQALAFLITDMQSAVDGARLLLHEAAWRVDRGFACEEAAAAAYAEAVEASRFIGPNGVQILGGHGFMRDYPVEKYMRESRALGLLLGGIDAAREEAGRALCERAVGGVVLSHGEVV